MQEETFHHLAANNWCLGGQGKFWNLEAAQRAGEASFGLTKMEPTRIENRKCCMQPGPDTDFKETWTNRNVALSSAVACITGRAFLERRRDSQPGFTFSFFLQIPTITGHGIPDEIPPKLHFPNGR